MKSEIFVSGIRKKEIVIFKNKIIFGLFEVRGELGRNPKFSKILAAGVSEILTDR